MCGEELIPVGASDPAQWMPSVSPGSASFSKGISYLPSWLFASFLPRRLLISQETVIPGFQPSGSSFLVWALIRLSKLHPLPHWKHLGCPKAPVLHLPHLFSLPVGLWNPYGQRRNTVMRLYVNSFPFSLLFACILEQAPLAAQCSYPAVPLLIAQPLSPWC